MTTLTGLKPFEEMPIVFTGMRPGEKLYEELGFLGEDIAKTRHPKIFIGKLAEYSTEEVDRALRRLAELARDGQGDAFRVYFNELLPDANLGIRRASIELGLETAAGPAADKAGVRAPSDSGAAGSADA
jgi:FlaA1/EpsC-like NDP-sugar epimerase